MLQARGAGAQTNTAEIAGLVHDAQGARLAGAMVTAEHLQTGARVQAVTDAEGRYRLRSLRVGAHTVTVELAGFTRTRRADIVAALGDRLQLDFVLELAGLNESVSVSGNAQLLQVTSAEISDVVSNEQILRMPLNARDVIGLSLLSDAVVLPPGGTRGEALQQAGPLPNVGGQRSGHNIYLLDGVKVTDELFNNLVINPPPESVQEFKIQKSQYAAEFGGKASALINVATRAGTNALRGSAFEFLRHEQFDARGYFDPEDQPVPRLRQHQFGAAFGGPLVRDRSFFFASYEGQRLRREQTRTFSVPSEVRPAWRPGKPSDRSAIGLTRSPRRSCSTCRCPIARASSRTWWRARSSAAIATRGACGSITSSPRPGRCSGDSAASTPTRCSPSGRAHCRRRWFPASDAA